MNYLKKLIKKIRYKNIFILLSAVVLLSTVFFVIATKKTNSQNVLLSNQSVKTDKPTQTPSKTTSDLTNLSVPIMMYHHIRDYNVATDSIGTNLSVSPAKFVQQLDLIKSLGYQTVTFSTLTNSTTKPIILTFDDGYQNFYDNAFPEMKKRGMVGIIYLIVNDIGKNEYLNEQEIDEIKNAGFEIGSHTLSHPDLTKISTAAGQTEIVESKTKLESKFNIKIISFCYPSGKYNEEIINLVQGAGYEFAVTTKSELSKFNNPMELSRYRLNKDTNINSYLK
jgi:peptidoglycan/xylan/chitin deacetylase (PgdA/CDA1 family)